MMKPSDRASETSLGRVFKDPRPEESHLGIAGSHVRRTESGPTSRWHEQYHAVIPEYEGQIRAVVSHKLTLR